jgi:hypothetical protein
MLICHQAHNLAIGCVDIGAVQDLVRVVCSEDGIDLRDEGILETFNIRRWVLLTMSLYVDTFGMNKTYIARSCM